MAQQQLSMSPSAVRSRERRAAAAGKSDAPKAAPKSAPKARKAPTASPVKLNAAQKRTVGQLCAAAASGFLPIASYMMAHVEAQEAGRWYLWALVAAALLFSAPTLAKWAQKWCGGAVKAWGFTVLLEGVLVASHTPALSIAALTILVVINASNAWELAARREPKMVEA